MSELNINWRRRGLGANALGPVPEWLSVSSDAQKLLDMRVASVADREVFVRTALSITETYLRDGMAATGLATGDSGRSPADQRLGISATLVHALSMFSQHPPPKHERVIVRTAAAELLALCDKLESEGR